MSSITYLRVFVEVSEALYCEAPTDQKILFSRLISEYVVLKNSKQNPVNPVAADPVKEGGQVRRKEKSFSYSPAEIQESEGIDSAVEFVEERIRQERIRLAFAGILFSATVPVTVSQSTPSFSISIPPPDDEDEGEPIESPKPATPPAPQQ